MNETSCITRQDPGFLFLVSELLSRRVLDHRLHNTNYARLRFFLGRWLSRCGGVQKNGEVHFRTWGNSQKIWRKFNVVFNKYGYISVLAECNEYGHRSAVISVTTAQRNPVCRNDARDYYGLIKRCPALLHTCAYLSLPLASQPNNVSSMSHADTKSDQLSHRVSPGLPLEFVALMQSQSNLK